MSYVRADAFASFIRRPQQADEVVVELACLGAAQALVTVASSSAPVGQVSCLRRATGFSRTP